MSSKIEAEVWERSEQKGSALVLLLAIAQCANDQGEAFPSEAELMQKTRTGKRGLRSLVDAVRESGELAVSGMMYRVTLKAAEPEPLTLAAKEPGAVEEVFEDWKSVHRHPNAKLDERRRKLIAARLKDYSVADLKLANQGCKLSPYHQGQNDARKIYDDIELIFRDAKHVEMFIAVAAQQEPAVKAPVLTEDERIMRERLDNPNGEATE